MPREDELPFEQGLSEELRRIGETFELSGRGAVVDSALAHGRRAVRRRRIAAVTGSVLALALVGGGGALASGLLNGSGEGAGVANSGPAVPTARATAAPSVTESSFTPSAPPSGGPGNVRKEPPPLEYTLVMPTLLRLLPEGLSVGETDSEGEFASAVVDDGTGRSLVQINVQPDMRDVADDLYREATTLPDGTLLATSRQPGEKGGAGVVRWTADTMRPDGLRVVVSAFNSGEQSTPATRPEPALTLDQLTALATSPEWLKLQPQ